MDEKMRSRIIPPADQPKGVLYRMSLRFLMDVTDKDLEDLFGKSGIGETPYLEKAVVMRLEQTVPFIPDDEAIAKYAEILVKTTRTDSMVVKEAHFDGYDYIYAIAPEVTTPTDNEQEENQGASDNP